MDRPAPISSWRDAYNEAYVRLEGYPVRLGREPDSLSPTPEHLIMGLLRYDPVAMDIRTGTGSRCEKCAVRIVGDAVKAVQKNPAFMMHLNAMIECGEHRIGHIVGISKGGVPRGILSWLTDLHPRIILDMNQSDELKNELDPRSTCIAKAYVAGLKEYPQADWYPVMSDDPDVRRAWREIIHRASARPLSLDISRWLRGNAHKNEWRRILRDDSMPFSPLANYDSDDTAYIADRCKDPAYAREVVRHVPIRPGQREDVARAATAHVCDPEVASGIMDGLRDIHARHGEDFMDFWGSVNERAWACTVAYASKRQDVWDMAVTLLRPHVMTAITESRAWTNTDPVMGLPYLQHAALDALSAEQRQWSSAHINQVERALCLIALKGRDTLGGSPMALTPLLRENLCAWLQSNDDTPAPNIAHALVDPELRRIADCAYRLSPEHKTGHVEYAQWLMSGVSADHPLRPLLMAKALRTAMGNDGHAVAAAILAGHHH